MSLLNEKRNKYVKVLFSFKNKAIVMLKTTATAAITPQKYFKNLLAPFFNIIAIRSGEGLEIIFRKS